MSYNTYPGGAGNPPSYEAGRQLFEALQGPGVEVHQWQDGTRTAKIRQPGATLSQDTQVGDMIVTVDDGTRHGKKYLVTDVYAKPDEWEASVTGRSQESSASVVVELPPQNPTTGEFTRTPGMRLPYGFSRHERDGSGPISVTVGARFGLTDSANLRVRHVTLDLNGIPFLPDDYPPARGQIDILDRPASVHGNIANPFDSAGKIGNSAAGKVRSKLLGLDKIRYPAGR